MYKEMYLKFIDAFVFMNQEFSSEKNETFRNIFGNSDHIGYSFPSKPKKKKKKGKKTFYTFILDSFFVLLVNRFLDMYVCV